MLPTIVRTTSTAIISSLTVRLKLSTWSASSTRRGRAAPRYAKTSVLTVAARCAVPTFIVRR
jgi:hypothetical protein